MTKARHYIAKRLDTASPYAVMLLVAIILMMLTALPWLTLNAVKLLWEQPPWGAVDLRFRYEELQLWFAGAPVYSIMKHAVYPPASYTMLWPWLGWLPFPQVRIVWFGTLLASLIWLACLFIRASGANTRLERVFVVMLLLSMYATGFSLGHGQLTIPVLASLLAGVLFLRQTPRIWHTDVMAAVCLLASLVKPTLSLPFFWLFLFLPGTTWQPVVLVMGGYAILTLLAIPFQGGDLLALHQGWATRGINGAAWGAVSGGYGDLHSWLGLLGLARWNLPASLLVLLALGYWTYKNRYVDMWLLLGVTALVARFWVYHRSYDDMLVLIPILTLFRLMRYGAYDKSSHGVATGFLVVVVLAMFIPVLLVVFPAWKIWLKEGQTCVRLAMLIFLLHQTWLTHTSKVGALPA